MPVELNYAGLVEAIDRIKRRGPGFETNYYASHEQTERWIERGLLRMEETGPAVFLFRRNRDFEHVYHFAAGLPEVGRTSVRAGLQSRRFVVDLIGPPAKADALAAIYQEQGFEPYQTLVRMTRAGLPEPGPAEGIATATPDQAPDIHAFLDPLLNPWVDQIPTPEELAEEAAKGHILVTEGPLAGVLIFEPKGITSTLRYWYVDANRREGGIGARLIRKMFELCRHSRRIVLWVVASNESAIAKYEHYGFRRDHLIDRILVRKP